MTCAAIIAQRTVAGTVTKFSTIYNTLNLQDNGGRQGDRVSHGV